MDLEFLNDLTMHFYTTHLRRINKVHLSPDLYSHLYANVQIKIKMGIEGGGVIINPNGLEMVIETPVGQVEVFASYGLDGFTFEFERKERFHG